MPRAGAGPWLETRQVVSIPRNALHLAWAIRRTKTGPSDESHEDDETMRWHPSLTWVQASDRRPSLILKQLLRLNKDITRREGESETQVGSRLYLQTFRPLQPKSSGDAPAALSRALRISQQLTGYS